MPLFFPWKNYATLVAKENMSLFPVSKCPRALLPSEEVDVNYITSNEK